MAIERRYFAADAVEVRVEGDGAPRIAGYGAIFDEWSPAYGFGMFQFRERLVPGFFDGVLDDDVRGLFNHDANFVLGRTKAGTMQISADAKGLKYDIDAPKTTAVNDFVLEPIRRRDVTGSSFSFELMDEEADGQPGDKWEKGADGVWERTLLKAKRLHDTGPVVFPWYPQTDTSIAQRSLESWQKRAVEPASDPQSPPAEPASAPVVAARELDTDEAMAKMEECLAKMNEAATLCTSASEKCGEAAKAMDGLMEEAPPPNPDEPVEEEYSAEQDELRSRMAGVA